MANFLTCILCGFVVFAYIGRLAKITGLDISRVVVSGNKKKSENLIKIAFENWTIFACIPSIFSWTQDLNCILELIF